VLLPQASAAGDKLSGMTQNDEALFSALISAICKAIVLNIIEMRSALELLTQRGLLPAPETENAIISPPDDVVQRLLLEVEQQVRTTMKEHYAFFLAQQRNGPIQ
jgi:hypothetical protein